MHDERSSINECNWKTELKNFEIILSDFNPPYFSFSFLFSFSLFSRYIPSSLIRAKRKLCKYPGHKYSKV